MSTSKTANRYALAVLLIAEEFKKLDEVYKDFQYIESLIAKSDEFRLLLKSPVVSNEKKKKILIEVFKGNVGELVLRFVLLLTSKGREALLINIIRQFYSLLDERKGIMDAIIKTTVNISDEQKNLFVQKLEALTKKKIRPTFVKDLTLKGGFTVQYKDTFWDASVKRQLELLEKRLILGTP